MVCIPSLVPKYDIDKFMVEVLRLYPPVLVSFSLFHKGMLTLMSVLQSDRY